MRSRRLTARGEAQRVSRKEQYDYVFLTPHFARHSLDCTMTGYDLQCADTATKDSFTGECNPFVGGGSGDNNSGGGDNSGGGGTEVEDNTDGDGAGVSLKASLWSAGLFVGAAAMLA